MSQKSIWGVFLLLCLCTPNLSMKCKWLQPQQERLSKAILLTFKEMGQGEVFPLQCMNSTVFPPNIDHIYNTTEVESAVVTLLEVTHQINKFYSKQHDFLGSNSKALETFQAHLHRQMEDLRDCISMNRVHSSLQWEIQKAISEYFSKLLEISAEKDNNLCARNIIRIEVQKQLQFTAQLTTRIRRQTLTRASVQ